MNLKVFRNLFNGLNKEPFVTELQMTHIENILQQRKGYLLKILDKGKKPA
jgi:hypothetical protein